MSSSRLPAKYLLPINLKTSILEQVIKQVLDGNGGYGETILLHEKQHDNELAKMIAINNKIHFVEGCENPTLRIFQYMQGLKEKPPYFVRLTADNPCVSPEAISWVTEYCQNQEGIYDYIRFSHLAQGTRPELFKTETFMKLMEDLINKGKVPKEHLTLYYTENKERFNVMEVTTLSHSKSLLQRSLSIDTLKQYQQVSGQLARLDLEVIRSKNVESLDHLKLPECREADKSRYQDIEDYRMK